jgi:integrase
VRNILVREVLPDLAERFPARDDDPGIAAGRLHSFRHYFCSMSADNDVPEQMLMAWLGHRDSEMIRHYYHLRQDEARKQMARIPFLGQSPADAEGPPDEGNGATGE